MGVHGEYGTHYVSIDLLNNKILNLDDILNKEDQKKLIKLLEKYLRKNYLINNSKSLESAGFYNEVKPNDNFYITSKGITFSYMPYEIACYAMGQIEIFIPFYELKIYLQDSFKKIIV